MFAWSRVSDNSQAVQYLRRDILRNYHLLVGIEKGMPPMPREVWVAAGGDGSVVGVMELGHCPHCPCAEVRAVGPEVLPGVLKAFEPGRQHGLVLPEAFVPWLAQAVPGARLMSGHFALALAEDDYRPISAPGEIRLLTPDDRPLTDEFPAGKPTLTELVEWADGGAQNGAVFGLIVLGEIVSFVQLLPDVDNLWDPGTIRTRPEHRRKGYAKAVLSHATGELLRQGLRPVYDVDEDNVASIHTALAVGYRKVLHRLSYKLRVD